MIRSPVQLLSIELLFLHLHFQLLQYTWDSNLMSVSLPMKWDKINPYLKISKTVSKLYQFSMASIIKYH